MIKQKLGYTFALPIVIGGLILAIAGVLSMIENPIIGIIMITVGLSLCTSSYGIQINYQQNKFREYGSMYGIKRGTWVPLDRMPYISVLKGRSGLQVYGGTNRSTTIIDNYYEVCLLNHSHYKKVVLKKFDEKMSAEKYGRELSQNLGKEFVKFSPIITEKTKSRRLLHKN